MPTLTARPSLLVPRPSVDIRRFTKPLPAVAPESDSVIAAGIAARIGAQRDRWMPLIHFDRGHRWHQRLGTHDGYEIWLLTWLLGQESPLHDHGGSLGAFTVVLGALDETIVDPSARTTDHEIWTPGRVQKFEANHVHRVGNDRSSVAASIHVYAPKLESMTRYRQTDSGIEPLGVERDGVDW